MKIKLLSAVSGSTFGALLLGLWFAPSASVAALDLDLQVVGGYGPTWGRVGVSGHYAYCSGDYLDVIDVSDPTHPKLARRYDARRWLYGLPVSTNFMYVPDSDETWMVYDISNPADPQQVGGYKTIASAYRSDAAKHTRVSGAYAYVTGGPLQVIDIHNPGNPQRVGSYDAVKYSEDVAVSGTFAYLAADGEFQILDISNPEHPVRHSAVSGIAYAGSVALYSHYVFVGGSLTLQVIDVRDPAKPQRVAEYSGYAYEIAISGNYAGLTGTGVMTLVDISDPTNPHLAGRVATGEGPGRIIGVGMAGNYAYSVGDKTKLHVIEIRPANPQRLAQLPFGNAGGEQAENSFATRVAVTTNYACVTYNDLGVEIVDISDPGNPRRVGGYGISRSGWFFGIGLFDHYACVVGYYLDKGGDELRILDLREPATPRLVGRYPIPYGTSSLAVSGNHAYLTIDGFAGKPGLQVIDLGDPANPRLAGHYLSARGARAVAISGQYAYVASAATYEGTKHLYGIGGLELVDVSNPAAPRLVGTFEVNATSVAVSGHYAYVTSAPTPTASNGVGGGLVMIDIADPANPRQVGIYGEGTEQASVAAIGDYAYVLDSSGVLAIISGANPGNLQRVGGNPAVHPDISSLYGLQQMAVSQGRLYVAAGEQGLVILDLFQPFRLQPLPSTKAGTFGLRLTGPRGLSVSLQRSTDLLRWETWQSINLPGGAADFVDTEASATANRWYRAVGHLP